MIENYEIWIDGVSNKDVGVRIASPLRLGAAVPRITTQSVPGRNGDLHTFDGSYKNRKGTFSAYVYEDNEVKAAFGGVHKWLYGNAGYRRVETDDDRDHYLLARVKSGADIDARIRKIAPFAVELDCKPQRFLISGDEGIIVDSEVVIYNPTGYAALPKIEVYLRDLNMFPNTAGDGVVKVGDAVINITGMKYGTGNSFIYDAETENAAAKNGTSRNSHVSVVGDVILPEGETKITVSGDITHIKIIPRWWEL